MGLAKWLRRGARTRTICGTLTYMGMAFNRLGIRVRGRAFVRCSSLSHVCTRLAPEMLAGDAYEHAVDWWSLGVLFYALCTGVVRAAPPFHSFTLSYAARRRRCQLPNHLHARYATQSTPRSSRRSA